MTKPRANRWPQPGIPRERITSKARRDIDVSESTLARIAPPGRLECTAAEFWARKKRAGVK